MTNTRGEKTLGKVTYSQVSSWCGLSVGHLRNLAARGEFPDDSLHELLCWVNQRRQRLGAPLIGLPDGAPPDTYSDVAPTAAPPPEPDGIAYDPHKAQFQEDTP